MKIAVLVRARFPMSIQSDISNITRELRALGNDIVSFSEKDETPHDCDIYWYPGAGRIVPFLRSRSAARPRVATFHGAANLALPVRDCFGRDARRIVYGYWRRGMTRSEWFLSRNQCEVIIAVSQYAKEEFEKYLNFGKIKVIPIYHGIDHSIFYPGDVVPEKNKYFLHVSSYRPKKNVDRIIAAYRRLSGEKPKLVAVVPGYQRILNDSTIEIIRKPLTHQELSHYYRNAFGFIFPSLHESFGHPIVEAMASGCPVITSNITSCPEVAGDAALVVNPRSVEEITNAMEQLLSNHGLRKLLRDRGIERARMFNWHKCAEEYLSVFTEVLRNRMNNSSL